MGIFNEPNCPICNCQVTTRHADIGVFCPICKDFFDPVSMVQMKSCKRESTLNITRNFETDEYAYLFEHVVKAELHGNQGFIEVMFRADKVYSNNIDDVYFENIDIHYLDENPVKFLFVFSFDPIMDGSRTVKINGDIYHVSVFHRDIFSFKAYDPNGIMGNSTIRSNALLEEMKVLYQSIFKVNELQAGIIFSSF